MPVHRVSTAGPLVASRDHTSVPFHVRPVPLGRSTVGTGSSRDTWVALVLFCAAIGLHLTGAAPVLTYGGIMLAGVACSAVGMRRYELELRWPWWSLVAAGSLWTIAGLLTDATDSYGDLSADRSLLPDLFAIPAYALVGAALVGILRARRALSERGALLDGIMVAAGAALVVNQVLVGPTLSIEDTWWAARIMVALYPTLSICLLALAGRLAFGSGERSVAFGLFLAGTACLVVGDIVYALGEIGTLVLPEEVLEIPYLAIPAFVGAAALHPSIRLIDQPSGHAVRPLGPARLSAVIGALLAPIAVIAVHDQSDGRIVPVLLCAVLVVAAVWRIVGAMRTQAASEADLLHRATHDELTGLPSRAAVVERTEALLDDSAIGTVALMFLDIDQFKLINDSMGHAVGDHLLVLVAERLVGSVRRADMVGRISGDEFVIVAGDLDEDGAHGLADRVRTALRDPFELPEGEVFVSVSIGVTIADRTHRRHASTLIQEADTAMYRSKDAGRNAVTIFDTSMRERLARRVEIERRLRRALDEDAVMAWYQPIVTMPDGHPMGLEALARWEVDGRMVSPAEFIPVAEESGLIVPLGAHVLDEACRHVAWWRRTVPGAADMYVSVNLSPRQVWASDIVDTVADSLRRHSLPGDALWLEITENVMMEDSVTTTAVMAGLRALGVRLAVDDFGTGFSSLSYLKRFPVSRVKIDRSFVSGLGEHESDSSLVSAIVAMATALDLEPVAEGVETVEQADHLVELGCVHAQGFLFGAAVPPEQVPDAIARLRPPVPRRQVRVRRCAAVPRPA
jgi:diguanylate cyclase (GGDEF)-like protein